MSVEFIGMIGVSPEGGDARVHVIDGSVDPNYIVDFSRAHEDAGFDMVLVGYSSGAADGLAVAQHRGGRHEPVAISHRSPPGVRRADAGCTEVRDARSALQRPDCRAHHHRRV